MRKKDWVQFSSVQSLSHVRLFAIPWIAARQASLSFTISRSSLRHIHRVSDVIQPSHHLSSPSAPAPNPSQHQSLFQRVKSSHEGTKVLKFQLQHHSLQRNPRTDLQNDWLDLLAVQGTLKSLLQHHSSKASILQRSAFFIVQLTPTHDYWKSYSLDEMDLCW